MIRHVNAPRLPQLSRQRTSDSVYNALRTAILARKFAPGQRLNVHELAAELGVSLTPVKDALTRLEAESLIHIRPRSGTFVTAISPDDVAEAFEIRCALECLAAEKALERATPEDIARLRALTGQIEAAVEGDDEDEQLGHAARNVEFHKTIVNLSGSRRLIQMYEGLDAHIQIARIHLGDASWKTRLPSERNEHLAIVDALARRDAPALTAALRHHILRAAESLVRDLRNLDGENTSNLESQPQGISKQQ
ncbi:MAG TPA: GntR family transcriptional regulator [Vicinamibacterales bacterium]